MKEFREGLRRSDVESPAAWRHHRFQRGTMEAEGSEVKPQECPGNEALCLKYRV